MNITKTLNSALDSYERGNFSQAEELSIKILRKKPRHADALHLLGMIFSQRGDYDLAIKYIRRALDVNPHFAEALNNLGNIYQTKGRIEEAISCFEKALKINPDMAGTYMNLGIVLQDAGKLDEAISCYSKVIQLNPLHFGAYNNLGLALHETGNIDEAIEGYRKVIELNPKFAEAFNNLGLALKEKGYIELAIANYQKALEIKPDYREAYNGLGSAYHRIGQLSQAVANYKKAIEIDQTYVHAYANIGSALIESGDFDEAERYCRRALELQQDYHTAYSNILFATHYNGKKSPEDIFFEHTRFAEHFEKPLIAQRIPFPNARLPDRRLKIGYLSPDFKTHSVAYFVEPALSEHDHNCFEIYCYSDVGVPDDVTERLRAAADHWVSIVGKSDDAVCKLIREHAIDILIDLAGHTGNNRLPLFARKPAPIQISWIGYPATTGLSAMDYKIVDNYTDPPGMTEHYYTERLLRLPEVFLCYLPDADSPGVSPLPTLSAGRITFGSFNNFSKISPIVLEIWQAILKELPNARFVMKAKGFSDATVRDRVLTVFRNGGIADDRLELLSWTRTRGEHLELYHRIDIALDTYPYHGTTTTCEALWMGVPVITLAGVTHASRVGVSLLTNVGLPELIATTPEEYVAKAIGLARDMERLQSLRLSLRDALLHSSLTDAKTFTRKLEEVYRKIWAQWCEEQK